MKHCSLTLTRFILILVMAIRCQQMEAQKISSFDSTQIMLATFYGQVLNEKNEGIQFVSIILLQGGIVKGVIKTDVNGNYKLKVQGDETYEVRVKCAGYIEHRLQDVAAISGERHHLNFQLETQETRNSLKRNVLISRPHEAKFDSIQNMEEKKWSRRTNQATEVIGCVTNARGKGIAGVKVKFEHIANTDSWKSSNNTVYMIDGLKIRGTEKFELYAVTDSNGNYCMTNLYPGTWKISFQRRGYKSCEFIGLKLGEYKLRFVATLQSGHDRIFDEENEIQNSNKEILLSNKTIYERDDFKHLPANNMEEMIDLLDRNMALRR